MKLKRALSLSIAIILVLGLLAGCSNNNNNENEAANNNKASNNEAVNTGNNQTVEDQKPAAADLDPYEIKWYMLGSGNPRDIDRIEKAANEYLKDKINATVDLNIIDWGSFDNKFNAMVTTREDFDIIFAAEWKSYRLNARKGAYWEIPEQAMDKFAPQTKALFDDGIWEAAKVDGKYFAIPNKKDLAAAQGFLYRKDIADKLGIDMTTVKDWEDLTPIFEKVKKEMPDISPMGDGVHKYHTNMYAGFIGGSMALEKDTLKPVNVLEDPVNIEFSKLVRDWFKKGYIRSDILTNKIPETENGTYFVKGEQLKPGKDAESTAAMKATGTAPADAQYGQVYLTEPYFDYGTVMGAGLAISSTSKDPERALMFIELLNNDKYLNNLFNFGQEGIDYEKLDGEYIRPVKDAGYSMVGLNWMYGNQYLNYLLEGEAADKWAQFDDFIARAKPSPIMGYTFDENNYKKQLSAYANIEKEFEGLYFGVIDPVEFLPKKWAKAKSAGMDKVNDAAVQQWNDFLSKKQ